MTWALSADGVTVRAGTKTLVDHASLDVAPGEIVALVGPNGAGKSTLLRGLSGELKPHTGAVLLKQRPITSYSPRELALRRAVLSQSVNVVFPFTVSEVVRMGAGDVRGRHVEALGNAALAEMDLTDLSERIITTLSGGEQQRAHFARVLVQLALGEEAHGPGVLLLDEPTSSLDLKHQLDFLDTVSRCARRGVAVVIILHDLNLASMIAERIAVLEAGRLAAIGTPRETITDDMMLRVFGCADAVGRTPPAGTPFVLPHAISVRTRGREPVGRGA